MVALPMTLSAPNHPKPHHFLHSAPPFIASQWVNLETSNLVRWFITASPTCRWKIFPERGVVKVSWPVLEFDTPRNVSRKADFVYRWAVWCISLVMTGCPLSGRGQGHVSNFYILDLENFVTASRRCTGVINVDGQLMDYTYDGKVHRGWMHKFIIRWSTVTLQL